MSKIFSKFLPPPNPASVIDINYSKTLLLCTFDNQLNRRGLPFYSDMSIYKRHIIYNPAYTGSIESISSTEGNGYIDLPRDKQTNVKRYAYFNNIQARNNYSPSILEGLYSEISANFLLGCNHGSNPIALLEDFTIEFSFYSDTVFANNNNYQCLFALSNYSQHFSIYLEESNPCKLFIRLDREIRELFRVELFTWYSVALIRDQGKIGLYVNNVFVKEFNFPGVIDKSIYTFTLVLLSMV
ncbi:MAG: hypothetical protein CV045_08445 [Cyanobacteria bacterium M5B4]|nr:MAG: hypothetical protein CV045_08445 [Cyanobacteria bacterium M5B4]